MSVELALVGARAGYGPVEALHGVTLDIPAGSLVGVLGRNGAGKSTAVRALAGTVPVREGAVFWQQRDRQASEADLARVLAIFPRLGERLDQTSGTLSGGEQQMLAVGRALMTRASLLLLDEPSMGLSPRLVREIFRVNEEINRAGTTILLVEQNANMALHIASRACILETGRLILSGPAGDLRGDPRVKEAYLGA